MVVGAIASVPAATGVDSAATAVPAGAGVVLVPAGGASMGADSDDRNSGWSDDRPAAWCPPCSDAGADADAGAGAAESVAAAPEDEVPEAVAAEEVSPEAELSAA